MWLRIRHLRWPRRERICFIGLSRSCRAGSHNYNKSDKPFSYSYLQVFSVILERELLHVGRAGSEVSQTALPAAATPLGEGVLEVWGATFLFVPSLGRHSFPGPEPLPRLPLLQPLLQSLLRRVIILIFHKRTGKLARIIHRGPKRRVAKSGLARFH